MSRPRYRGSSAPKSRRWLFILIALLVAAGIVLVAKSLLSAPHVQVPTAVPAAQESNNAEPVAIPPQSVSTTVTPEADVPTAAAVTNAVGTQPAPAATGNATAGNNSVTLRLEFTAASWSEIYDASGKRLMFEVGQPGQVRTVAGQAPLKVILGVAAAAKIAVNDRSVAVPRQPGKDATRFMVAADGSVR
jgi:cytoskeletal protein RodZ